MAKKITFTLFVLLIVSAFVFVSCNGEAGGVPGPAPIPREPVENELGEESANLVYNGDFNSGTESDVVDDGSEIEIQAGIGIEGSGGLYVFQNSFDDEGNPGGWGETLVDITKYYARGKSYYVEASFKNIGGEGTPDTNILGTISFSVVSGAGYNKYHKTYDVPGQYDYGWLDDALALSVFEKTTSGANGVDLSDGNWHTISGILDAETIEQMLVTQTENHGKGGEEPTLFYMAISIFVGKYPYQDGYKYVLDNVKIIDLNAELPREGKTWVDPDAAEEEEEEGE